ncbi:MAG: calcium/sodium antiporter [Pseudomonadales bacterium]
MLLVWLIAGLVLLVVGAEALVRGASRLAVSAGISPLVVGLTVVAFGTSSPELAVSVEAALSGNSGIAVGNVIGSNIFNVLFILGLSALIVPLAVSAQLVRLEVPLMIVLSVLVLLMALDDRLGWIDGAVLLVGLVVYVLFLMREGRVEDAPTDVDPAAGGFLSTRMGNVVLVVVGLALLVLGSSWLVDSAVDIAGRLGVSDLVVGLTIVAAGTSMPEVVTSVIAAIRGERDIAVGNVVGSNIFNIMGVLGVASVVAPDGIPVADAVIGFDLPVMIAVALACLPIFFIGGSIGRWKGAMLLAYYVAYTAYLIMAATDHDALGRFSAVMLYFVLPITAITLAAVSGLEYRRRRRQRTQSPG